MTVLVTGGEKCGKSLYAEHLFQSFPGKKFYLATMQPDCEAALETIARHRAQRKNKGFETIERYFDIADIDIPSGSGVLLEDVVNLCANLLFDDEPLRAKETIIQGVDSLRKRAELLVIVSNQVTADAERYSRETECYRRLLGEVNAYIAACADTVVECVFSIPVFRKGRELW